MKLKKSNFELSLVIPLFNEEQMVGFLCLELIKFKKEFPKNTEIIFIDDGSNDSTFQLLKNNEIKNY